MIKSFVAEEQTSRAAGDAMDCHKVARMRRIRFSNVANIGFGVAMRGMYLLGVVYCAYGILNGTVTYGTLTAIMQLISQIEGPFVSISGYLPRYYAMLASAERLMEIETFAEEENARAADEVRDFYKRSFSGLCLRDAYFTYKTDDSAPVVLDGISIEIRKGEYVAFSGHSGCGKSTVLKLLMCMYPLNSGERILMSAEGDIPLDASWRRLFAYVPQGNALMNGTIREVVSFADPGGAGNEERLRRALWISCADEFVDDLTEQRLLQNLRALTDKTVVIVTHRKAALSICDRVLRFTKSGVKDVNG